MYQAAQRGFFNGADFRGYPFGAAFVQQGDAVEKMLLTCRHFTGLPMKALTMPQRQIMFFTGVILTD
jgi:hypothetical protein